MSLQVSLGNPPRSSAASVGIQGWVMESHDICPSQWADFYWDLYYCFMSEEAIDINPFSTENEGESWADTLQFPDPSFALLLPPSFKRLSPNAFLGDTYTQWSSYTMLHIHAIQNNTKLWSGMRKLVWRCLSVAMIQWTDAINNALLVIWDWLSAEYLKLTGHLWRK